MYFWYNQEFFFLLTRIQSIDSNFSFSTSWGRGQGAEPQSLEDEGHLTRMRPTPSLLGLNVKTRIDEQSITNCVASVEASTSNLSIV